ncbi:hypothetical protein SAMN04488063_2428 [Halopelagius inordinatus]|uniref:Uncharacterized protein n=1 Tax=Halopelagius inordinatus TaxID=553467 RepID=A0A1I2SWS0_9EURY|nr:hypothetical protein [Halopelagius inordinatus]SFG56349.1 hypothetical protein SAMN04488063_2428 [Halopelagius inordinatus]
MVPHRSLAWASLPSAFVPATATAQFAPDSLRLGAGTAELVVLGLLGYAVYVAVSVVFCGLVVAVSEFVSSGSYVRDAEKRLYARPVRTGALGIGVVVGGIAGTVLLAVVLLVLVNAGAPEPLSLVAAVPVFGGLLFLSVASAVGTVVLGSALLRRVRGGEPSLWVALVVGSLVVNVPLLNLVFGALVAVLGAGAIVGRWWENRRDGPSGPAPGRPTDG